MNNIIPLELLNKDAKIPVIITHDLYSRIQQLIFEALPFKDMDEFMAALREAKSGDITTPLAHHLQTLLHLASLIEESAKASKLTVSKQYDLVKKEIIEA